MSLVERKQDLFENIARLRRAGRALPGNRDIAAVRVALERELGEWYRADLPRASSA